MEKISYYKIKMNEAKVFKDEVNYNYWSSNLKMLQDTKEINSDSSIYISHISFINLTNNFDN